MNNKSKTIKMVRNIKKYNIIKIRSRVDDQISRRRNKIGNLESRNELEGFARDFVDFISDAINDRMLDVREAIENYLYEILK
jgi:hypothetical protein